MAIKLTVNGKQVTITSPPDIPLLHVMRAPAWVAALRTGGHETVIHVSCEAQLIGG